MAFIRNNWLKFITNVFNIPIMTKPTFFDELGSLGSIPLETSILSYCNNFITQFYNSFITYNKHSSRKVCQ